MSYPITVDEEELDLFRIARLLGKPKVLELVKTLHTRGIGVDDVLSYVRGEIVAPVPDKEALSFIFGIIKQKFPDIKVPEKFRSYVPEKSLPEFRPGEDTVIEKSGRGRRRPGEVTPQGEYGLPILEALTEMGGSGRMRNVLEKVYDKMKDRLKPKDLEMVPSGTDIRWKNHAAWERFELIRKGYLKNDSPRGIWEITDEGRKHHNSLSESSRHPVQLRMT